MRARVIAALIAVLSGAAAPARAGLTEGPRLARIYDTILGARFDEADARLAEACPPAPAEACDALAEVETWWRIQLDPDSRALDGELTARAARAIAASEAWTAREPDRGEAWFYLAGAYAPLVQWHVLRGKRMTAAREGNRIRQALERALALDPSLQDAYFGIGLYHYYADVASAGAKFLRWLLMLPGGDRVKGLQEMLRARDHGELLSGEADFQLHLLYLWYERKPERARELLEELDARYPTNPLFLQRLALVDDEYLHDHIAGELHWHELAERAAAGRVSAPALAAASAQLGMARELDALDQTDRAIAPLETLVESGADSPYGVQAAAHLQLARAHDRLGQRDRAVTEYRAAIAAVPAGSSTDINKQAEDGLAHAPDPRRAAAYRTSLEGWRALERGNPERAADLLAQATEAAPNDTVAVYRYARALDAAGRHDEARRELESVVTVTPPAPAFVRASAFVDLARAIEHSDRARAIALYSAAATIVGGDRHARDEAARALKRLTQSRIR
ncbi:MAG: tetratricopeptide repeat protein [Betaproteobacteria bacterium]